MSKRILLLLAVALGGCSGPLPQPDPQMAWVELYTPATDLLMADRLDGKRWPDGRYFEVSPGSHTLEVRYQYDISIGAIGLLTDPSRITCYLRVRYDDFVAGGHYRLEMRNAAMQAMGWLYGDGREPLVRAEEMRCGPF